MHHHPEGVAIFMTDGKGLFTFPDGKTAEELDYMDDLGFLQQLGAIPPME